MAYALPAVVEKPESKPSTKKFATQLLGNFFSLRVKKPWVNLLFYV